jgi:hypothetical protein
MTISSGVLGRRLRNVNEPLGDRRVGDQRIQPTLFIGSKPAESLRLSDAAEPAQPLGAGEVELLDERVGHLRRG